MDFLMPCLLSEPKAKEIKMCTSLMFTYRMCGSEKLNYETLMQAASGICGEDDVVQL